MSIVGDKKYLAACEKYYLKPGYVYVTMKPTVIAAVLGSCVSVCLYDTEKRFGGMNHYLFPEAGQHKQRTAKYGDVSIMALYKSLCEFGSSSERMVAQIVGGGYLEGNSDSEIVSKANVGISRQVLEKIGVKIVSEDIGGVLGRKILYITEYNELVVTKLKEIRKTDYYYAIQEG